VIVSTRMVILRKDVCLDAHVILEQTGADTPCLVVLASLATGLDRYAFGQISIRQLDMSHTASFVLVLRGVQAERRCPRRWPQTESCTCRRLGITLHMVWLMTSRFMEASTNNKSPGS